MKPETDFISLTHALNIWSRFTSSITKYEVLQDTSRIPSTPISNSNTLAQQTTKSL